MTSWIYGKQALTVEDTKKSHGNGGEAWDPLFLAAMTQFLGYCTSILPECHSNPSKYPCSYKSDHKDTLPVANDNKHTTSMQCLSKLSPIHSVKIIYRSLGAKTYSRPAQYWFSHVQATSHLLHIRLRREDHEETTGFRQADIHKTNKRNGYSGFRD